MEVAHAQKRADERGLKILFKKSDMQNISMLPDSCMDKVISNGAFCLAPNKEQAFRECFRVLKPGGRMVVCTSTVTGQLEAGVNWPVCMQMFIRKELLKPMCEKVGFTQVVVDDSDSLMSFELPEGVDSQPETQDAEARAKNQVHVGSKEFEHLQNYDMNALCARVAVIGTKPSQ